MRQLLRDTVSFHGDDLLAHEDELARTDLEAHGAHERVHIGALGNLGLITAEGAAPDLDDLCLGLVVLGRSRRRVERPHLAPVSYTHLQ